MPPSPKPPGSPNRLELPRLYAVVDVELCAAAGRLPLDVVRAFLSAGVRLLQLRAKTWDSGAFLDLAHAAVTEAQTSGAVVIVNDRADIAALSGAQGLHVGQDDLSPADARTIIGPASWVGLSSHTEAQWTAALKAPISYLAIGPVFGTATKVTGYESVGLDAVSRVAAIASKQGLPVVAIGGITLESAAEVIDAGATSVAVISDLLAGEPTARATAYLRRLSG